MSRFYKLLQLKLCKLKCASFHAVLLSQFFVVTRHTSVRILKYVYMFNTGTGLKNSGMPTLPDYPGVSRIKTTVNKGGGEKEKISRGWHL